MQLKDSIKEFSLLKSVVDMLHFSSSIGYSTLLTRPFMVDKNQIELLLEPQIFFTKSFSSGKLTKEYSDIKLLLSQIKNIYGTVKSLQQGVVLSESEFFEIKHFCDTSSKIDLLLKRSGLLVHEIPSLEGLFSMLDPINTKEVVFYIYDIYSEKVALKRKEIRKTEDREQLNRLYLELEACQNEVLEQLSLKAKPYSKALYEALDAVAMYDFLLASSELYTQKGFTVPAISDSIISYKGLFNPIVEAVLKDKGLEYQKIDIELSDSPLLVIGANMSGKSVLLQTIALSQYLVQYGFFTIADQASVSLKDSICISIDNQQTIKGGLSSFASEMIKIDSIVSSVFAGDNILALIDEPARTTNPIEGAAIVGALADLFIENNVCAVMTTHYSNIKSDCRRVATAGIREDRIDDNITKDNINSYVDYSLKEVCADSDTPKEAIRICEIFKLNDNLIKRAKTKL